MIEYLLILIEENKVTLVALVTEKLKELINYPVDIIRVAQQAKSELFNNFCNKYTNLKILFFLIKYNLSFINNSNYLLYFLI